MVRRITDVHSDSARRVFGLRQRFLAEHPHEVWTPMEQLIPATSQGTFLVLSLELVDGLPVGFAVLHAYHWGNTPVLWLDEVYIEPESRHQELFEQFVSWCGHYCQVSGVPTLMTNVWTKAEGAPFIHHVAAEPVVLTLRMTNPVYKKEVHREQHPDSDTSRTGEHKTPRKKSAVSRRQATHRPGDRPGVPGEAAQ